MIRELERANKKVAEGFEEKMAKILLLFKLAKLVETKVVVFQALKIKIKTYLVLSL